jgi:Mn2+/Fe2+ NRAMP family transporter
LNLMGIHPVKILFLAALINGFLAPFILVGVLLIASDKKLMRSQMVPKLTLTMLGLTIVGMCAAVLGVLFNMRR